MSVRLRRIPLTLALMAVLIAAAVAAGTIVRPPDAAVRNEYALGAERLILGHDLVSLLASVLLTNGPAELIVALLAVLVVIGATEIRVGAARTLVAYLVTGAGGGLVGVAAQAAGLLTRGIWSTPPADLLSFHPFTPIFGTAMTASAFAGPLWRRRIRVLGLAGLVVVLLYSGQAGDVYRLAGALVGLVVGMLLARHRPRLAWPRSSHHETRTLLAVVVGIGAVGPLVAVFQHHGYGLLRPLGRLFGDPLPRPQQVRQACLAASNAICDRSVLLSRLNSPGTILLDVLPLVVLLIAAIGIWNGRRAAAWAAVLVNAVLGLLAAVYYNLLPILRDPAQLSSPAGPESLTLQTVLAALLPAAVAAAILANLRHLTVRTRPRVTIASVAATAATAGAGSAAYLALGLLSPAAFTPHARALDLAKSTVERYVPVGFLRLHRFELAPAAPAARVLSPWIGPAAWIALAVGTIACALLVTRPRSSADELRVRALLKRGSWGSISFMAAWAGNRYWFSDDHRHAIAFRESSGIAITLGEPIGPSDGALEAARSFVIACDDRAVTPAFYAVRPGFADAIGRDVRWSSTSIGEDTVLDPATFSMRGKQWQDVRSSINRADRAGINAVWTEWSALSAASRAQIEAISEEWVADHRLPELGFTLGGLAELRDPDVQLMLAVGPDDRIEAVTSWLPTWRDGALIGLTLDFMRRHTASMNGVMEFLIASVVTRAQQRDLEFVSLSVAPLAQDGGDDPDPVQQLLQLLARVLEPAYGFASLATFKAKFKPAHVPVVLAYPDALSLPAISLAITRAYLPDLRISDLARFVSALRPETGAAETKLLHAGSTQPPTPHP